MHYSPEFDVVKGIIEYCNDNLRPIEKIQFRGGNTEYIEAIVSRILNHWEQEGFIDGNRNLKSKYSKYFRQITFFLVLNTDFTYKFNLNNDPELASCLNVMPQLTKCLLLNLIWMLKLDNYLYEILHYTPCWFMYQHLEPIIQSIKYIKDPYDVLCQVEHLLKSIYGNMCRGDLRVTDIINQKIMYQKFFDFAMDLLRQFYTPDAEKFQQFTKREFHKYSGYALNHLLNVVLYCLDGHEGKYVTLYQKEHEFYEICKHLPGIIDPKSMANLTVTREIQFNIIVSLLNTLQFNVMLITVDIFMSWVEIDFENDTKNLQAVIGEKSYYVLQRIEKNSCYQHDVAQNLKFITIKPKTIHELVAEATMGQILNKIENVLDPVEQNYWMTELFNRSITFDNEECLDTIRDNIQIISVANIKQIFNYITLTWQTAEAQAQEQVQAQAQEQAQAQLTNDATKKSPNSVDNRIIEIIIKSLMNFPFQQLQAICLESIKSFGKDYSCLQLPNLDQRCNEFFNRCTDNFDMRQFLMFSIEYPNYVWKKFYDVTLLTDAHIQNYCNSLQLTKELTLIYFEPLFFNSFHTMKYKEPYFAVLAFKIYLALYQDESEKFIRHFLNSNCTEFLNAEEWDKLLPIIDILSLILLATKKPPSGNNAAKKTSHFDDLTVPLLLMAAQMLDKCRWDLFSYLNVKDQIVNKCAEFIKNLSKKFLPIATEKDRECVQTFVQKYCRTFTQFYFQKYSLPTNGNLLGFDQFLLNGEYKTIPDMDKFVLSVFVRCTFKEAQWLAKSHKLLPHISNTILLLNAILIDMAANDQVLKLYNHCMLSYAKIVNNIIMPRLRDGTAEEITKFGMKILEIFKGAPAAYYEHVFMSYHSILLDIFKMMIKPIDPDLINQIEKMLDSMKDCQAKKIINDKFHELFMIATKTTE